MIEPEPEPGRALFEGASPPPDTTWANLDAGIRASFARLAKAGITNAPDQELTPLQKLRVLAEKIGDPLRLDLVGALEEGQTRPLEELRDTTSWERL